MADTEPLRDLNILCVLEALILVTKPKSGYTENFLSLETEFSKTIPGEKWQPGRNHIMKKLTAQQQGKQPPEPRQRNTEGEVLWVLFWGTWCICGI